MEKTTTYTQTLAWADLAGPACGDDRDWDDCYDYEAIDARRAERDGWGGCLVWDGR